MEDQRTGVTLKIREEHIGHGVHVPHTLKNNTTRMHNHSTMQHANFKTTWTQTTRGHRETTHTRAQGERIRRIQRQRTTHRENPKRTDWIRQPHRVEANRRQKRLVVPEKGIVHNTRNVEITMVTPLAPDNPTDIRDNTINRQTNNFYRHTPRPRNKLTDPPHIVTGDKAPLTTDNKNPRVLMQTTSLANLKIQRRQGSRPPTHKINGGS
jgi:hypothetical protein